MDGWMDDIEIYGLGWDGMGFNLCNDWILGSTVVSHHSSQPSILPTHLIYLLHLSISSIHLPHLHIGPPTIDYHWGLSLQGVRVPWS
jgi:hypothetical protein